MFYVSTVLLGWVMVNFVLSLLCRLLDIEPINDYFWSYVVIGYAIMWWKKIPFPMNGGRVLTRDQSPYDHIQRIELKLFFKEIYHCLWWPYYLLRQA